MKTVLGSNSVRGRKNRKKARNHAVKNAVTATQTSRRRRWSISVFEGPAEESPAAAAAFDVPTAGVPTYFVASTAPGAAGFSAFAGAKHGLRALAQSLAREMGPKGVHVAHVVIDGAIDGEFIRGLMPDAAEKLAREEILVPDEIARNYVWLYRQNRIAWTFEMDLRPWAESW